MRVGLFDIEGRAGLIHVTIMAIFELGLTLSPFALPVFITAVLVVVIGAVAYFRNDGSRPYQVYLTLSVITAVWLGAMGICYMVIRPEHAVIVGRVAFGALALIPTALYLFTVTLTDDMTAERGYLLAAAGGSLVLIGLTVFTDYMLNGLYTYSWGHFPRRGPAMLGLIFFSSAVFGRMLYVLQRAKRRSNRATTEHKRFHTLTIAILLFALMLIDLFPALGIGIYPFGYVFVLISTILTAWAIWQYQLSSLGTGLIGPKIFNALSDAAFVIDRSGTILLTNRKARQLCNRENQDLTGEPISKHIYTKDVSIQALPNLPDAIEGTVKTPEGDVGVRLIGTPVEERGTLRGGVIFAEDIEEHKEAQQQIEKLRYYHAVTDLPDKNYLAKRGADIDGAQSTALIHVNHYTRLVNSIGHDREDQLLNTLANLFASRVPGESQLFQWARNKFAVVSTLDVETLQERLMQSFQQPFNLTIDEQTFRVFTRVGLSARDGTKKDVQAANIAAEALRTERDAHFQIYDDELKEREERQLALQNDIEEALQNGELDIKFHPQMKEGEIEGVESLVRWDHPELGFVPPPDIVKAAMETAKEPFLQFVLEETARHTEGAELESIGINIAAPQMKREEALVHQIEQTINNTKLDPEQIELEITESTALSDLDNTNRIIGALRDHGFRVALDDFGTGHATLQYLVDLPVDTVKIDKSFVMNLDEDDGHRELIRGIIGMKNSFDLSAVAEGVEESQHLSFLKDEGCKRMQGFYWTQPLAPDELYEFLQDHTE